MQLCRTQANATQIRQIAIHLVLSRQHLLHRFIDFNYGVALFYDDWKLCDSTYFNYLFVLLKILPIRTYFICMEFICILVFPLHN